MTLLLINQSIVFTGQDFKPELVHPSSLEVAHIIDSNWEIATSPVTTNVISNIVYRNGIIFNCDNGKLQIIAQRTISNELEEISNIALTLFQDLQRNSEPTVQGVGINFIGFVENSEPEQFMIDQLLQPGPWKAEALSLEAVGYRLVYDLPTAKLTLNCDSGSISLSSGEELVGFILNGNFHHDITTSPSKRNSIAAVKKVIREFTSHREHFTDLVIKFFDPATS